MGGEIRGGLPRPEAKAYALSVMMPASHVSQLCLCGSFQTMWFRSAYDYKKAVALPALVATRAIVLTSPGAGRWPASKAKRPLGNPA